MPVAGRLYQISNAFSWRSRNSNRRITIKPENHTRKLQPFPKGAARTKPQASLSPRSAQYSCWNSPRSGVYPIPLLPIFLQESFIILFAGILTTKSVLESALITWTRRISFAISLRGGLSQNNVSWSTEKRSMHTNTSISTVQPYFTTINQDRDPALPEDRSHFLSGYLPGVLRDPLSPLALLCDPPIGGFGLTRCLLRHRNDELVIP